MPVNRLRVPDQDGAHLIEPSAPPLQRVRLPVGPLQELRQQARAEVRAAARDYLGAAGEPLPHNDGDLILMSGHQPELFHPGVWLKNFVLNRLARTHGTPIHLLVDNDAVKTTALLVPAWRDGRPHALPVPIDRVAPGMPYEEWTATDDAFVAELPGRVELPLLTGFWDEICRQSTRTRNVPERFSAARRACERRWGCHNLELPVSRLCDTPAFVAFAEHLLSELPRFHDVFNSAVRAYRREHGLRSRHHPFPELVRAGDELEAPFWFWRPGDRVRQRLFGQRLPAEVKVRPRAITLTLFARLFVADLFLHGIGGAKYDAVTDEVIRRFYGVEPPPFVAVTGTLRLPLPTYPRSADDLRRLERLQRDLVFNPQRHLAANALTQERAEWVCREPIDRAGRRERFRALRRLNEELAPLLAEQRQELERERERCVEEIRANAVLRRRDWAFCLYAEPQLRAFVG